VLAPLLILWGCVFGGRSYVPFDVAEWPPLSTKLTQQQIDAISAAGNHDATEVVLTFPPERAFASQELRKGRLPEWNPYARIGAPLLATSVVGLLYPPNWPLLLAADPTSGAAFGAWLALALAGVLTFGLLRAQALPRFAALFGGVAFELCGALTANAHFYQRLDALIWLPGMLWGIHALARRSGSARLYGIAGLALCTFFTWTAGFAPYAAPVTLAAGLWLLWLALQEAKCGGSRKALEALGCGAAGLLLGMTLAAAQLLPMFAFFPESNRDPHPTLDSIASQGFDPFGLLGYVLPAAFGDPTSTTVLPYDKSPLVYLLFSRASWTDGRPFLPTYNYIEYTVFPGAIVLALALLGACSRAVRERWPCLVLAAVLWTLAIASPTMRVLYSLPGLESVPPMRMGAPCSLLVAVLAAHALAVPRQALSRGALAGVASVLLIVGVAALVLRGIALSRDGLDWLRAIAPDIAEHYSASFPLVTTESVVDLFMDHARPARDRFAASLLHAGIALPLAAAFLLARLVLRAPKAQCALVGLALAGTAFELVQIGLPINRGLVLHEPRDTDVHRFLREQRDRFAAAGGITVARAGYDPDPKTGVQSPTPPLLLPPCTLVPERIRDLHAYTFVDGRSHRCFRKIYSKIESFMLREYWPSAFLDDDKLELPFFDLLGLRYVLARQPLEHAGKRVGPEWKGPKGPHDEFFVYERESALPRAFVASGVADYATEAEVIAAITAEEFRPRERVCLLPDQKALLRDAAVEPGAERRGVRFVRDEPTSIALEVEAGPAGLLVMSDAMLSGWTAAVDGQPVPLVRGDLFCRVVALPRPACRVEMSYRTPRLDLGLALSGAALVAWLALLAVAWRRR
jgi:hypothetical protein